MTDKYSQLKNEVFSDVPENWFIQAKGFYNLAEPLFEIFGYQHQKEAISVERLYCILFAQKQACYFFIAFYRTFVKGIVE